MVILRAAWVCPMAQAPLRDGWVGIADGRITHVGGKADATPDGAVRDLGRVALMPGVVNAHTHLELSGLRGNVPPAAVFTDWVKQLMAVRGRRRERADDQSMIEASRSGCREAREFGTALIGDITNSLTSIEAIRDQGLRGLVFHELLGFNLAHGRSIADTAPARRQAQIAGGDRVKVSIAPHAPYSVSPEMFVAIRAAVDANDPPITSVHLGESDGEVQLLESGTGPWPALLKVVGSWRDDWQTPGCGPVEYLDRMHMLDPNTLVVHGVQLGREALARLATIGCTVVTCPRSNQWVGAGAPPIARFYDSGVRVAIGTDSLASVDDLNIFAELKTMRGLAPGVPAATLLHSATLAGAEALGFAGEVGSIEPGKSAQLIAIELPPTLDREVAAPATAVEEFLVSGITARQIAWVTA